MIFTTSWHLLFTVAAPLFLKSLLTKWLLQVYNFLVQRLCSSALRPFPFSGGGSVMFPAMGVAAAPAPSASRKQGYPSNLSPIAKAVRKNEWVILPEVPSRLIYYVKYLK